MDNTLTAEHALDALLAEGYDRSEAVAAIDHLIHDGLESDQPDDETLLTARELDSVRRQLGAR